MSIETQYIVISLKHTHRRHAAITLWQPNDSGYCWQVSRAGEYSETCVLDALGYYNSGCANIAVPASLVAGLSREMEYETKMSGVCLPNTREVWKPLLDSVIRPTDYKAEPEFKGARYRKAA